MKEVLIAIEVLSGLALIITVLLHSPKGEGLGSIGGQARLFNNPHKDLEAGLNRVTYSAATIFMSTATLLGLFF
jgi:preprotein translocase subunit SecG